MTDYPCDVEPRYEPSAHICTPRYGPKGDRCWCGQTVPSDLRARLAESVRMLDGQSNVVELAEARAKRKGTK